MKLSNSLRMAVRALQDHIALIAITLTAVSVVGCSTAHPESYSAADEPMRLRTQETNGLRISTDAILDHARSEKYFGTDTLKKGIIPVFVRVENVSSPGSALVEKEQFKITVNANAAADGPVGGEVEHRSVGGEVTAGVGVLALATPLIIVGSAMVSTADEVRHNFVDKEFRNQSLSPGRSAQGFVYCQMSDRNEPVRFVSIAVPVRNLQTDQTTVVQFLIPK